MSHENVRKARRLPHTSRVNDKILDYCKKFANDRELIKFMRLYSPENLEERRCRSTNSKTSTTTSSSSDESAYMTLKRLFEESNPKESNKNPCSISKAMEQSSSLDKQSPSDSKQCKEKQHATMSTEENDEDKLQKQEKAEHKSNEQFREPVTPHRNVAVQSQQTQTPDSTAKLHKRLEWDSLADIGYNKKSKSTNNLSTIERSVLREYFKGNSSSIAHIAVGKEEVRQSKKNDGLKIRTRIQANERHIQLTPLASSTRVEIHIAPTLHSSPENKQQQEGSQKLQQEKCVQTSMTRSQSQIMQSSLVGEQMQAVQTNYSTTTHSAAGSSMTPSSFEFMRPLDSTTTVDDYASSSMNTTPRPKQKAQIMPADGLQRLKGGAERTERPTKRRDETKKHTWQSEKQVAAVRETTVTPSLDMGIDLICKLFDTRRIEKKEKKKLVRQMVNVLTKLERDLDAKDKLRAETTENTSCPSEKQEESQSKTTAKIKENQLGCADATKEIKTLKYSNTLQQFENAGIAPAKKSQITHIFQRCSTEPNILVQISSGETPSPSSEEMLHVHDYARPSPTLALANSENAMKSYQGQRTGKVKSKDIVTISSPSPNAAAATPSSTNTSGSSGQCNVYSHPSGQTVIANTDSNTQKHTTDTSEASATAQINKEPLICVSSANEQPPAELSLKKSSTRSARTLQRPIIESMISPPSSSSQSKTTTKNTSAVSENNNSKSSTELEPNMNEWLNPLTQSEFEFEMKQQHDKLKAAREKVRLVEKRRTQQADDNSERQTQLQWIEAEIKRLSGLKKLLSKQLCSSNTSKETNVTQREQIYDTVYSSNVDECVDEEQQQLQQSLSDHTASTGESASAVQVIIEESSDNLVCVESKSKTRRMHSKETHVEYDKSAEGPTEKNTRHRRVKETIITQEQALSAIESQVKSAHGTQRSKMETPSDSQSSHSVASLVQERKQDFLEHYRNKHKTSGTRQVTKRPLALPITCHCGRCYSGPAMHVCTYPPRFLHPPAFTIPPHSSPRRPISRPVGTQPSCTQMTATTNYSSQNQSSHTATSSSALQQSSEISVPMGSRSTDSSVTTTHHYDDVAAAVASAKAPTAAVRMAPKATAVPKRHYRSEKNMQAVPEGVSYFIRFNSETKRVREKRDESKEEAGVSEDSAEVAAVPLTYVQDKLAITLQERLRRKKPAFIEHAQQRQQVINEIHTLRQERGEKLREIVNNSSFQSLDRKLRKLPPPPIKQTRILSSKEMKEITNKRYATLPEVVDRKQRELEERQRRNNRLMRDIFNRRLQKRVRQGKLSLNHCSTVL